MKFASLPVRAVVARVCPAVAVVGQAYRGEVGQVYRLAAEVGQVYRGEAGQVYQPVEGLMVA